MKRSSAIFVVAMMGLVGCKSEGEAPTPPAAEPQATVAEEAKPAAPAETAEAEAEKKGAMPENLAPGQQGFYGAQFTVIEEPIALAKAIELSTGADQTPTVKVAATVKSVCKKKGCWFTMTGEGVDADIRVKMKDYSFFVPKNADGAKVVAEGTLTERVIPQDEAQHYADDAAKAGEPSKKVEGDQKAWEFTATAVELVAAES